MQEFFKKYDEWIFGLIGLLLFGAVIACAVWVVTGISAKVGGALSTGEGGATGIQFKIEDFKKLDLRGLNPSR